jgi:hypothetical protein
MLGAISLAECKIDTGDHSWEISQELKLVIDNYLTDVVYREREDGVFRVTGQQR